MEQTGRQEEAEELLNQPSFVAPVQAQTAPKIEGVATVDTWKFYVENPAQVPREYLIPDEKKIGQIVRAMKGAMQIPGVKIWVEKTPRIR